MSEIEKLKQVALEAMLRVQQAPKADRARVLGEELAKLPPDMRDTAAALIAAYQMSLPEEKKPNWERVALLVIAVLFLATFLILAVAIPNPTQSQRETFRTILALMAAAFGAFIPGLLTVQISLIPGLALRAVGAAAFFAVVYFYLPKV